jgi:2-polyprenyl-6-methoxyphenol hydroxylase-like FAD-dependent oxidoreductase
VLIAGAGPAGASLALLLARGGIAVELVDASSDFARRFRGEALMPSGLEALARMGLLPLPAEIPQRLLRGWSFFVEGRPLFEVAEPIGSPPPCTLIEQEALLAALVAEAARQPGFRLLQGVAVSGLLMAEGRVAGVELEDGSRREVELVIGCDGRDSRLRRRAGLPYEAANPLLDVLWFRLMPQAGAPIARWLDGRFVTVLAAGASFALYETARGGVQLGWALDPAGGGEPPTHGWVEILARCSPPPLAQLLAQLPEGELQGPVRLPVRVGRARRWQRPGLLLLGDAAHPMSPLRAQGLNMALRDALVAAERLVPALQCGEPAAIDACLERIEAERLPEIRTIQALQQQEGRRARRLQQQGWLRQLLARTAPWSGPLLARRWSGEQRMLRQGLPLG